MTAIGTVQSVWRYPVKSMRGEELEQAFVRAGGVEGDRLFAFTSGACRTDFPYFTARQQPEMLLYRPRLIRTEDNATDTYTVEVETPDGSLLTIDDPSLAAKLVEGLVARHHLTLLRANSALADCFPMSLLSQQTATKLSEETGRLWDKRRFRANIYLDLPGTSGFAENELLGRKIRLGETAVISIEQRDLRCVMINLDPDTARPAPALLKQVAQTHSGAAGVYGTALKEGTVRAGDLVQLVR